MKELLRNLVTARVEADPFPHIILRDAVDEPCLAEMDRHFPDFRPLFPDDFEKNNIRLTLNAKDIQDRPDIHGFWKRFAKLYTSEAFFQGFRSRFPECAPELDAAATVGVKGIDDFSSHEVLLNCMLCVNTPVTAATAVRRGHVDLPNKLYTGLLYLRDARDESIGGDLELYRFAASQAREREAADALGRSEIDPGRLERAKTAPYAANTLVLFANRADAAHGVTPRAITPFPRRFLCLTAEVARDRFQLSRWQHTP